MLRMGVAERCDIHWWTLGVNYRVIKQVRVPHLENDTAILETRITGNRVQTLSEVLDGWELHANKEVLELKRIILDCSS